jgi:uncharacterized protein (TIGR04141 family)
MTEDARAHQLTIYFARSRIGRLQDMAEIPGNIQTYELPIGDAPASALLLIRPPQPTTPRWAEFFDGYLSPELIGKNTSIGATLLVRTGGRHFALTFGNGRHLLATDAFEERFGLKVALNCIGEGAVRSIDKHSLDQLLRHSREQASRDATTGEFGFDIEQDLLKGVTGKPEQAYYGKRISGMDALHLSVQLRLNDLPELLENVHKKFVDSSYKKTFPWVDQISQVASSDLLQELDEALVQRIAAENTANIWMAVPELISWEKVGGFRFRARRRMPERSDIHLDDFIEALAEEELTLEALKERQVICVDENGEKLYTWHAYKCLYAEIDHRGQSFLLSGGTWYQVTPDFVKEVDKAYDRIPNYEGNLPEYNHASEAEYLKAVANSNRTQFALMDQKPINFGGGHSKVEFCDLLTRSNDLLHIKRYGQASALSHLFAQGTVSGELFQTEAKFRRMVNDKLPETHKLENPERRPKSDAFRVIFGIVSDRPGSLRLPFFSRVNLKHATKRLEAYGFRVAKTKINVSDVIKNLAKFRPRKRNI